MHHSSPSAITYPSPPQLYYLPLPYRPQPYSRPHDPTTHLTALPPGHDLLHTALRPASTLLHPALLPISLPYHLHTTYPCPTPPSSTTHLTALRPAHDLLLPYSTQLYYPPHYLSTCTRPTPLLGYLS